MSKKYKQYKFEPQNEKILTVYRLLHSTITDGNNSKPKKKPILF